MQSLGTRRFSMVLLTTFALVALALTCVGIYGVSSYSVAQRTREIGVRIALGAQPRSVVGLVVRQSIRPAIVGLGAGFVLALLVSRLIATMLFGVGPRDPLSLSAVASLLAVVALGRDVDPCAPRVAGRSCSGSTGRLKKNKGPPSVSALWNSAPFGIQRRLEFSAVWNSAPFGIQRSLEFSALWNSAP